MRNCKLLSIDESGKASYNHPSDLFTLSGIVIPEEFKPKIDRQVRRLKKKFFKDEEIVFHSRDMFRKKGSFHILQDPKIETAFWLEYISILNNPVISVIFIITNKNNAKSRSWQPKTILEKSYKRILEYFVKGLKKGYKGKIITESDPSQDLLLIKAHNHLQGVGTSDKKITAQEFRNTITSLSLVNKRNQDVDVQMADCLALVGSMLYRIKKGKIKSNLMNIDKMKLHLIERKLVNTTNPSYYEVLI